MHEGKSSPSAASEIRRVKEENTQLRALLAQRDEQIQKMRADLVKKNSEVFLLKQQLEDIKIDECFSTMPEEITPTKPEPDLPDEMKDIEDMDLDELQQKLRDLHAKVAALQGQTQLVEKKITQLGGVWTTPTEWAQSVIHPPSVVDPLGTLEAREGAPRTASHARSSPSIGFIEDPSTCSSPMASSGDLWTDFVKWMRVHGISTMDDMKEFLSKHMNKRWLEGLEHIPRDSPLQEPENTTNNHNKTTTTYTQQPHHDVPLRTTSANSGGSSNPQALEMSYTSHQSDVEDAPLPTRFADDSGVPTTSTPQLATTTRHQVEHSQHVQQPRTGEDLNSTVQTVARNLSAQMKDAYDSDDAEVDIEEDDCPDDRASCSERQTSQPHPNTTTHEHQKQIIDYGDEQDEDEGQLIEEESEPLQKMGWKTFSSSPSKNVHRNSAGKSKTCESPKYRGSNSILRTQTPITPRSKSKPLKAPSECGSSSLYHSVNSNTSLPAYTVSPSGRAYSGTKRSTAATRGLSPLSAPRRTPTRDRNSRKSSAVSSTSSHHSNLYSGYTRPKPTPPQITTARQGSANRSSSPNYHRSTTPRQLGTSTKSRGSPLSPTSQLLHNTFSGCTPSYHKVSHGGCTTTTATTTPASLQTAIDQLTHFLSETGLDEGELSQSLHLAHSQNVSYPQRPVQNSPLPPQSVEELHGTQQGGHQSAAAILAASLNGSVPPMHPSSGSSHHHPQPQVNRVNNTLSSRGSSSYLSSVAGPQQQQHLTHHTAYPTKGGHYQ